MDICDHPETLELNGEFLIWSGADPFPDRDRASLFTPTFSNSPTSIHSDVHFTNAGSAADDAARSLDTVPWAAKRDHRVMWRGSPTGIWIASNTRWLESQRERLVNMTDNAQDQDVIEVLRPTESRNEPVGRPLPRSAGRLSAEKMDVAFAGSPIQCTQEMCPLLEQLFNWRDYMGYEESLQYKYLLDVSLSTGLYFSGIDFG